MRDVVRYKEPLGFLGSIAHFLFVRRTLDKIFDYRRDAVRNILGQGSEEPTLGKVANG